MMHGASEKRVLVTRGRRVSLLLVRERIRRLLIHEGFRDRVAANRAKAKLGLLASLDRLHVTIVISPDTSDEIAHRGRDLKVMRRHSPNHQ